MTELTAVLLVLLLIPVVWGLWREFWRQRLSRPLSDKWPQDRSGR